MADIQSETFTVSQLEEMSELLRAIAHPLRIMIIDLLKDGKQLTVTQIQKELHIEQAVASHHLIILKNKDVLDAHRSGKTILYYLRNEYISRIVNETRQAV